MFSKNPSGVAHVLLLMGMPAEGACRLSHTQLQRAFHLRNSAQMTSLVSPLTTSKGKEKETPIQTRTHTHKKRSSLQSISGVWESPGGVRELWEGASNAICVNCTHIGEPSSTHQHYYSSRLGGGVSGAHTRSKGAHINQFGSTAPSKYAKHRLCGTCVV